MNYISTFIAVAPDTKAEAGSVPVERSGKKSVAVLEYELLAKQPYKLTQEEVQFAVHCARAGLTAAEIKAKRATLWNEYFAKPRACLRASPLAKTYGWGFHFDAKGRAALVACDSANYQRLAKDQKLQQTCALRSKRAT